MGQGRALLRRFALLPLRFGHAYVHGVAGPGEGHIEQAQAFPQLLPRRSGLGPGRLAQIHGHGPHRRIMEQGEGLFLLYPGERQKHHVVLQPLGAVHGDDLHQIFVAFEALLVSFVVIAALARPDKARSVSAAPAGAVKALEALPEVPQVRENSRPLGVPEAAGRHGIGLQNSEQRRQHP